MYHFSSPFWFLLFFGPHDAPDLRRAGVRTAEANSPFICCHSVVADRVLKGLKASFDCLNLLLVIRHGVSFAPKDLVRDSPQGGIRLDCADRVYKQATLAA